MMTHMYEWLHQEIAAINTPKFHVVDGPLTSEQAELVRTSPLDVPPSYKEFVIQFGNARLYRQGSVYLVQVYAVPDDAESQDGEPLVHIGRTDLGLAYFKESLLVEGQESPVFEWTGADGGLMQTAKGFEEWITRKCKSARRQYGRERWSAVLKGPKPFTDEERAIVEARKHFRWRVVGVADNGDLQFEVQNGSTLTLPYLTIGVRGKHGRVQGGVWLPVSHIRPGQTAVIEKDCYKRHLAPDDVEVFEEPDPEPEDREEYWEFQALQ